MNPLRSLTRYFIAVFIGSPNQCNFHRDQRETTIDADMTLTMERQEVTSIEQ